MPSFPQKNRSTRILAITTGLLVLTAVGAGIYTGSSYLKMKDWQAKYEEQRELNRQEVEKILAAQEAERERGQALLESLARELKEKEEFAKTLQEPKAPVQFRVEELTAKVLAVKSNLAMLSVGTDNNVKTNDRFQVTRNGKVIATLVVDKAYPEMSSAKISLTTEEKVETGDTAVAKYVRQGLVAPVPAPETPGEKKAGGEF